jgi:hypothetical protein
MQRRLQAAVIAIVIWRGVGESSRGKALREVVAQASDARVPGSAGDV